MGKRYTPPEVVNYMVDKVMKEVVDRPDGVTYTEFLVQKLLPFIDNCPCCGSNASLWLGPDGPSDVINIYCGECSVELEEHIPSYKVIGKYINMWNRRVA